MFNFLFKGIYQIPFESKREQTVYKAFHVYVLAAFAFFTRIAFFKILPAIWVDRGVKVVYLSAFAWFVWSFFVARMSHSSRALRLRPVYVWGMAMVVYMLLLGYARNSSYFNFYRFVQESLSVVMMLMLIEVGTCREYLRRNLGWFLFLLYLTTVIMLATQNINIVGFDETQNMSFQVDEERGTTSLAYKFRGVLMAGNFFFLVGCFWKQRMSLWMRFLCLFSVVPYAYFQIIVGKFRSHLLTLVLDVFIVAWFSIRNARLAKNLIVVLFACVIGFAVYKSDISQGARERMQNANEIHRYNTGTGVWAIIKGERAREFECFVYNFPNINKLFGGGLLANYDASSFHGERGLHWVGCHTGYVVPLMRGGVLFLLLYLALFVKAFSRRLTPAEKEDGFLLACKGFVLIVFVRNWVTPIAFDENVFPYIVQWLTVGALWANCPPTQNMRIGYR